MITVGDQASLEIRKRKPMTIEEQLQELRGVVRVIVSRDYGLYIQIRDLFPEFFMEE